MTLLGVIIILSMGVLIAGFHIQSLPIMIFSRFLFGLAGDSLTGLCIAMFFDYFTEQEVGFALGIFFLLSHLGVLVALKVSPVIALAFDLEMAYIASGAISLVGMVFRILLQIIDFFHLKNSKHKENPMNQPEFDCTRGFKAFFVNFFKNFPKEFWISGLFMVFMFNGLWVMGNSGKIYIVEQYYPDEDSGKKDLAADADLFTFHGTVIFGNILFGYISYKFRTYTWAFLPSPLIFIVGVLLTIFALPPKICFAIAGCGIAIFYSNFWSNIMTTIPEKDRVPTASRPFVS